MLRNRWTKKIKNILKVKQKQNNDKQTKNDLDVHLVKLKEKLTSVPAVWNIKHLRQYEHISIGCPERLSIICHHDSKRAGFHLNYAEHELML